jgi:hypothetical protein
MIRGPGGSPYLNKAEVNKILCVLLKAKKLEISLDIAEEVPGVIEATSTLQVCTTTKTGRNTTLTKKGPMADLDAVYPMNTPQTLGNFAKVLIGCKNTMHRRLGTLFDENNI